jgi:hypothetical protein
MQPARQADGVDGLTAGANSMARGIFLHERCHYFDFNQLCLTVDFQ